MLQRNTSMCTFNSTNKNEFQITILKNVTGKDHTLSLLKSERNNVFQINGILASFDEFI